MNQRIMLTKTLLKNALTEMLQSQSIYQISIRELCQNAGINRSTFYKYYGSQFDLLSEMEQDLMQDVENFLSGENDYAPEALVQALRYLENNIDFVRLLFNSNVDPEFPGKLFSLTPIQRMLQGLSQGEIPQAEYEYSYNMLLFGAFQVVRMWINKDERESPEWLATFFFKNLRVNLRTE